MTNIITAGLLIIGDEILSGRTQDKNLNFIATELAKIGVALKEVRVVGDFENEIIDAVNFLRNKYNYVFTSGGIGPTHDDITSDAIAKAFNVRLIQNQEATDVLFKHYGKENVNEARMKMAFIPETARLLDNPISSAPGFKIENVFVMAGIPKIFQAMFFAALSHISGGNIIESKEIKLSLTESVIAKDLEILQNRYKDISMGSYPFDGGTSIVFRGYDHNLLETAFNEMVLIVKKINSDSIIKLD